MDFLSDLGRRITQSTDDYLKSFLFKRLSMLIQRYNAVAVLGTFAHTTPSIVLVFNLVFSPRNLYYGGQKTNKTYNNNNNNNNNNNKQYYYYYYY